MTKYMSERIEIADEINENELRDSFMKRKDEEIAKLKADHEAEIAAYKAELTRILANGDLAGEVIGELEKKLAVAVDALEGAVKLLKEFTYESDDDSCEGMAFFEARINEDGFFIALREAEKIIAQIRGEGKELLA